MSRRDPLSRFVIAGLLFGIVLPGWAVAQLTAFTYQGRLKSGASPANGQFDFQFALWNAAIGGAQQGSTLTFDGVGADPPPLTVTGGLFTVQLDFGAQFPGAARYLEIAVRPHAVGAYTTLSPRQQLTPTPYAIFSEAPWVTSGANVHYTGGNVGIGVSSPASTLDFSGDLRGLGRIAFGNEAEFGTGTGAFAGYARLFDFSERIQDFSAARFWSPLLSVTTVDPAINLTGANSKSIIHALIGAQTPAGNSHDVAFVEGAELAARHSGSGNVELLLGGVVDCWLNGGGTIGSAVGLETGSFASSLASGTIQDVRGIEVFTGSDSASASITTNTGIYVRTPDTTGPISNNYGLYVEDQAVGQNTNYAIYSAGGNSHFGGDVTITGTLSKGAGSFKIDHPLDPENKFLYHSFVESPDMMNVYNGNVVLDEQGEVTVELPEWFEALNREFRYQLTCIGGFAPVYVAQEIAGNQFRIAGGKPGLKVSWQVTGIRHDAYAEAHRIPVEEEKPAYARGAYLHPLEHGQPAERGLEAAHRETVGLNAVPPRPPGRPVRAHGS